MMRLPPYSIFFFFNDTATTEIYTLSLHDALPICQQRQRSQDRQGKESVQHPHHVTWCEKDRKSTRLNSSHSQISYAVFCLKKKKKRKTFIYNKKLTIIKKEATDVTIMSCCRESAT